MKIKIGIGIIITCLIFIEGNKIVSFNKFEENVIYTEKEINNDVVKKQLSENVKTRSEVIEEAILYVEKGLGCKIDRNSIKKSVISEELNGKLIWNIAFLDKDKEVIYEVCILADTGEVYKVEILEDNEMEEYRWYEMKKDREYYLKNLTTIKKVLKPFLELINFNLNIDTEVHSVEIGSEGNLKLSFRSKKIPGEITLDSKLEKVISFRIYFGEM